MQSIGDTAIKNFIVFDNAETLVFTGLVLFVAYLVRGISGFGSGLIAIPLLTLMHPLTTVVPLVVVLDFLGSAAQGLKNRELIRWPELYPLLGFTVTGCLVALFLFKSVDVSVLTSAMAIFIICFAIYQILPLPVLRGSKLWAAPAGFFGGLVGTTFGTGGPFYMMYLSVRGIEKSEIRASFAAYFFIDGTIRIIGFFSIGLFTLFELITLCWWLPAAALGLFIGGKVHTGVSASTFKYFISLLLVYSGYKLLTR